MSDATEQITSSIQTQATMASGNMRLRPLRTLAQFGRRGQWDDALQQLLQVYEQSDAAPVGEKPYVRVEFSGREPLVAREWAQNRLSAALRKHFQRLAKDKNAKSPITIRAYIVDDENGNPNHLAMIPMDK